MSAGERRAPDWWGIVPILCLAIGCAALVQTTTPLLASNDFSHYAQVRAFDSGTPKIDAYADTTTDEGVYRGHYYSDKAPGLAFETLPVYRVARSVGVSDTRLLQLLTIFGSLLPAALLLVLVLRFVESFEPGAGPGVATMLWLGSLLLPFSTVFFSHVLAACLGFASYLLLWRAHSGRDAPLWVAAAGVLGGLAVTTEYPAAILVAVLGAYALTRPGRIRRGAAYAAGVVLGLVPLLAYNLWAFGSPFHISYSNVAANDVGFFGLVTPSLHTALDLLFGERGLFIVTPLLAVAAAGIILLYREGRRSEAGLAGAVALSYLAYNASYYLPFGGWTPGPRFLITVIPFLGLPLATALRRVPALTLAIAGISAATMIAATLTLVELPDYSSTSLWWQLLVQGDFGVIQGAGGVAWFAAFAALAVVAVLRKAPRLRIGRRQLELALAGIAAWIVVARAGPALLAGDSHMAQLALIGLVVAVAAALWLWPQRNGAVLVASAPLLAFAFHDFQRHYEWGVLVAAASLGLMVLARTRARLSSQPGASAWPRA
jgi:hypothetical protein